MIQNIYQHPCFSHQVNIMQWVLGPSMIDLLPPYKRHMLSSLGLPGWQTTMRKEENVQFFIEECTGLLFQYLEGSLANIEADGSFSISNIKANCSASTPINFIRENATGDQDFDFIRKMRITLTVIKIQVLPLILLLIIWQIHHNKGK